MQSDNDDVAYCPLKELHPEKGVNPADNPSSIDNALKEWVKYKGEKANCEELIIALADCGLNSESETLKGYCQLPKLKSNQDLDENESFLGGKPISRKSRVFWTRLNPTCIGIVTLTLAVLISMIVVTSLVIWREAPAELASEAKHNQTSLPTIIENTDNLSCKALRAYSTNEERHILRVMPDWSRNVLDFCTTSETLILLTETDFLLGPSTPIILCPERVTAIEIYVELTPALLQELCLIFCSLETVVFSSDDICHDEGIIKNVSDLKTTVKSIRQIKFENLNFCANIFRLVYQSIYLPNMISMTFRCVAFEQPDFSILESILYDSSKVRNILCSDSDFCSNFNLKVSSHAQIITEKGNCTTYE